MLVKSLAKLQCAEHTEQKSDFILGYVIFGLDVHLCTSSVQRHKNCLPLLSMKVAGLRGLILH